jgi:cyclic pyranopterin phosphate synthase
MLENIRYHHPIVVKGTDDFNDTCKSYHIPGFKGKFGFITSMSEHFCGTCNRLRVLADGNLKVCLFGNTEVNLRDMLRNNEPEEKLLEVISAAGNHCRDHLTLYSEKEKEAARRDGESSSDAKQTHDIDWWLMF